MRLPKKEKAERTLVTNFPVFPFYVVRSGGEGDRSSVKLRL